MYIYIRRYERGAIFPVVAGTYCLHSQRCEIGKLTFFLMLFDCNIHLPILLFHIFSVLREREREKVTKRFYMFL